MSVIAVILLFVAGCGIIGFSDDPLVARVRLNYLRLSDVTESLGVDPDPVLKKQFIDRWVEDQLWVIEAKQHSHLNKKERQQLSDYRSSLLVEKYRKDHFLKDVHVNENEVLDYYKNNESEFMSLKRSAFIEIFTCSNMEVGNEVLSNLRASEATVVSGQLKLVSQYECVGVLDDKIFSNNPKNFIGPIKHNGLYYVVHIIENYPKNTLLRVEHVREDIIQKLRMAKYSRAIQQKQKELKDRINVKIF